MESEERTRRFSRNEVIDCRNWRSFVILESTYRYWRIRYVENVDKKPEPALECDEP